MRKFAVFCYGGAFIACLIAMLQDIMGKEAYLHFAEADWQFVPWWLWLPVMAIIIYAAIKR